MQDSMKTVRAKTNLFIYTVVDGETILQIGGAAGAGRFVLSLAEEVERLLDFLLLGISVNEDVADPS